MQERLAMDIPNDLNKLLAQLKEVTSQAGRMTETWASGPRPSIIDVDFFLSQYKFHSDAMIERIEISNHARSMTIKNGYKQNNYSMCTGA